MICNGELSDPLCDSVNRGLTLVRLGEVHTILTASWFVLCKCKYVNNTILTVFKQILLEGEVHNVLTACF